MLEMVKRSIFVCVTEEYDIHFQMVRSYFSGDSVDGSYCINDSIQTTTTIKEIKSPMPILNVDDDFFFEDECQLVKILKVVRTDKDNVIYVINTKRKANEESLAKYEKEKQKYLNVVALEEKNKSLQDYIYSLENKISFLKNRKHFGNEYGINNLTFYIFYVIISYKVKERMI